MHRALLRRLTAQLCMYMHSCKRINCIPHSSWIYSSRFNCLQSWITSIDHLDLLKSVTLSFRGSFNCRAKSRINKRIIQFWSVISRITLNEKHLFCIIRITLQKNSIFLTWITYRKFTLHDFGLYSTKLQTNCDSNINLQNGIEWKMLDFFI